VVGLLSPGQYGAGNVWLAASVRQNDARRSHSRYPILREAGWLAAVVSLAHIGVVGTGDLAGDCELTQGVNPGQERGLGVVLCCKL